MKTVEMHLAYVWDCDACGRENFVRAVVHEVSPEEARELAEEHGAEGVTGNWMTAPEQVQCDHCKAEFKAKHFREDDNTGGAHIEPA